MQIIHFELCLTCERRGRLNQPWLDTHRAGGHLRIKAKMEKGRGGDRRKLNIPPFFLIVSFGVVWVFFNKRGRPGNEWF